MYKAHAGLYSDCLLAQYETICGLKAAAFFFALHFNLGNKQYY